MPKRRPKPWPESGRQGGTRYVWRFEGQRYRTRFYDDPEEARADAAAQITAQMRGTWRDRSGSRMRLEEWIDVWAGLLDDIEPTTVAKYRYLVEFHILPAVPGPRARLADVRGDRGVGQGDTDPDQRARTPVRPLGGRRSAVAADHHPR